MTRCAPGETNRTTRWERTRRRLTELARTQAALWENLERIAPDPDPYLHWEPTTAGWRLYGHLVAPCPEAAGNDRPV